MVTFIEITSGANEGSRFEVQEGLTIGRSAADILIKDPKVSSTHARFALDPRGHFVLQDLNSSNGLFINGRRVKKVALLPGVTFEVGRTEFKVLSIQEDEALDFSRFVTWRTVVAAHSSSLEFQGSENLNGTQGFSPPLRLSFIQGIQADQEIVLGYGPRKAGLGCLDIELLEETAPKEAFLLLSGPGMVEIQVLAPNEVLLNNSPVKSEMLKDGDMISIGKTKIKVSYL